MANFEKVVDEKDLLVQRELKEITDVAENAATSSVIPASKLRTLFPILQPTGEKMQPNDYYKFRRWFIKDLEKGCGASKLPNNDRTKFTAKELSAIDTDMDCMAACEYGTDYFLFYKTVFVINIHIQDIESLINPESPKRSFTLRPIIDYDVLFYDNKFNLLDNQTKCFKSLMIFRGRVDSAVHQQRQNPNANNMGGGNNMPTFQSWRIHPLNVGVNNSNIHPSLNIKTRAGSKFTFYEYNAATDTTEKVVSTLDTARATQFDDLFVACSDIELKYDPSSNKTYIHTNVKCFFVDK